MATPTSSEAGPGGTTHVPPGPLATPAVIAGYLVVGACLLGVGALVRRVIVAGRLEDPTVLTDRVRRETEIGKLIDADGYVSNANWLLLALVVVTAALVVRWALAVRRNRAVLGDPGLTFARAPRLVRAWWVLWPLGLLGCSLSRQLLAEADTPSDRQRLDLLEIAATAGVVVAAGLTIAVVSVVTARQQAAARAGGVAAQRPQRRPAAAQESGLRVVAERDRPGSNPPGDGASRTDA